MTPTYRERLFQRGYIGTVRRESTREEGAELSKMESTYNTVVGKGGESLLSDPNLSYE